MQDIKRIKVYASITRYWGSGQQVAVYTKHCDFGTVELDIPSKELPVHGLGVGDKFQIVVLVKGTSITGYEVPSDSDVKRHAPTKVHYLSPTPPKDWNNPTQVSRYRRGLQTLFGDKDKNTQNFA